MTRLIPSSGTNKPHAVIVARESVYRQLQEALTQKLLRSDCTVSTPEHLTEQALEKAAYLVYLGYPSSKDQRLLQTAALPTVISLQAQTLNTAAKADLKPFVTVFLPDNFASRLDWIVTGILESLVTRPQRPRANTPVQSSPTPSPSAQLRYQRITHPTVKASSTRLETAARQNKHSKLHSVDPFALVNKYHILSKATLFKLVLVLFPLLLLSTLVIYPYLLAQRVRSDLQSTIAALKSADFELAQTHALRTQAGLTRAENIYHLTRPLLSRVAPAEARSAENLFTTVDLSLQLIGATSEFAMRGKDLLRRLISHDAIPISQETRFLSQHFSTMQYSLTKLETSLSQLQQTPSRLTEQFTSLTEQAKAQVEETQTVLEQLQPAIPLLPNLLAADGRKKYLILFQNNMELRPTGGFIGSVGFLRFENGKMLELTIEDVYSLDGQLEGEVDPPQAIGEYLQPDSWFLRDANWDPDFTRSASQIQWFLKKEIGTEVDGVIAIDLEFAKRILNALDGVPVQDYNTFVTADNLYLKTQTAAEGDFFPGSTGKRDFLGSLARSILLDISTREALPTAELLSALHSSLAEKHILLHFDESDMQNAIDNLGWSGRLLKPECQAAQSSPLPTKCAPDYLMVVEANLGANKVNYFIERATHLAITVNSNRLQRKLTLTYTNQSSSADFPGGTYKNYLRILTPPNATFDRLEIDGRQQDIRSIEREITGLYQSYGLFVEIPPKSTREITAIYSSSQSFNEAATYELLVQKQPGLTNSPFTLSIEQIPGRSLSAANFKPLGMKSNSSSLVREEGLIYNTILSTDKIFRVKIM